MLFGKKHMYVYKYCVRHKIFVQMAKCVKYLFLEGEEQQAGGRHTAALKGVSHERLHSDRINVARNRINFV